jgi:tetratricopeptide (TPR) repeat protein
MYIPILGLFYIFVEAGGWLIQKIKGKRILYYFVVSVIALVVISLSVITNTRCRQWKDTFTLFSGIIMEYPDAVNSKYAYNGLANWYLDKGDTVNAVKCSEKSHQLDNAYPDYYYFKSRLAYLRQDYKNSLDYLNEAISHCKSIDKDVYSIFKSDILCKLKYYDQALLSADGVIKNKYFTSLGYELKGKIYYEMGNYESAISESSKAIEMNSYDADAYTTRCLSYKYLGESQKSANDFKKLSEVEASYAKIE